jgi:hypothetical protein
MLIAFLVLWVGYLGQVERWDASYKGCLRATLDRAENADGWRMAETARRAAFNRDHRPEDLMAAREYHRIVVSLESRTRPTPEGRQAFCAAAFPRPGLF